MYELNNELIARLRSIVSRLEEIVKTQNLYSSIVEEYRKLLKEFEHIKTPNIYGKDAFDRFLEVYMRIDDVEKILDKSGKLSMEEIASILDELKESIYRYIDSVRRSYQREVFVFNSPLYVAMVTYLIGGILYALSNSDLYIIIGQSILALTALASIFLTKRSIELSYLLLAVTAILGIFITIIHPKHVTYDQYNILLCMAILMLTVMNLQTVRVLKSSTYRDKVKKALDNLKKFTRDIRMRRESSNNIVVNELEEKARRIFREIYGDEGDKLLQYKVNILVMHGYRREDALKKIISMYSGEHHNSLL